MKKPVLMFVLIFASATLAAGGLDDGYYKIRSAAGNYLSYDVNSRDADIVLNCLPRNKNNIWYLKEFADGGYGILKGRETLDALDLSGNLDTEGNKVHLWTTNGTAAQRWFIEPNGNGFYLMRTSNSSGRVITDNGAMWITIQTDKNHNTQKWIIERASEEEARASEEEARFARYRRIMRDVNKTDFNKIALHNADGYTNKTLKAAIAANPGKENMIEGKYVVLHFPDYVWANWNDPKEMIDAFDRVYEAELELIGRTETIHNGRMIFLTDNNPNAPYMYAAGDYCAFSVNAAEGFAGDWNRNKYPGWGVGHEIGHTMVNRGAGALFEAYDGESWCNIFNIYAFDKSGRKDLAREDVSGMAREYNDKYARHRGTEYDMLSDRDRVTDILAENTQIFVKFPLLLIDNYGWDGMRAFLTKAARDHGDGVKKSEVMQGRIDYMAVNLSVAYKMDLSDMFDYWRVFPSKEAKARISHLPKERLIMAFYADVLLETPANVADGLYKIRSFDGNYLSYDGGDVPNGSTRDGNNTWYLRKAGNGSYYFFVERDNSSKLLDLSNNRDSEGNAVHLWEFNGSTAQTWFIDRNGDGSYKMRTGNSSRRVITDNGAKKITIKTYGNHNAQKWAIERDGAAKTAGGGLNRLSPPSVAAPLKPERAPAAPSKPNTWNDRRGAGHDDYDDEDDDGYYRRKRGKGYRQNYEDGYDRRRR